ncbi:hypothetical protein [Microbacterium sp. nov. GSS16]|uniref:hypothetical protein n=1 Tax=Microbacterium sp. nov. GSS16 TaxID=3019890 RepID=UPI0023061F72|nr:hypothetical protein [Microbacterium sp. nov. GSS16]WCD91899.1 hypothetical protein PGB26_09420 [Microbacterium sp. nov. GSS16]
MRRDETLRIGPSVSGALLRVLTALMVAASAMAIGAPPVWLGVAAALAVFGALLPSQGGTWLAAGALVIVLLLEGPDGGRAAIVVAAVHALHVLGSLSLVVPASARVSLRALRPTALRFAAMQAVGQIVLHTGMVIPAAGALPLAVIAGAIAALTLALGMLRMLDASRTSAFAPSASRSPSADAEPGVGGRSYT